MCILAASLAVYFLAYSPKGNKSLVYNFSRTIKYDNATGEYYGGSLLGWNASGQVSLNDTNAVEIFMSSSISRQFRAVSSKVVVSFTWTSYAGVTETMTMVIHRQLNGVYSDWTYNSNALGSSNPEISTPYTSKTGFGVDNGTLFTVELTMNNATVGFLNQVELWNSAEVP